MGGFYEGYQNIVVKKIKDWFVDSYSDSIGTLECKTSIDLIEKEYKKFIHNIYPILKNGMKTMMIYFWKFLTNLKKLKVSLKKEILSLKTKI